MAHFAELDENNIVKRVVVVGNDVPTADGPLGELGNKLLIIIVLEKNLQGLEIFMIL